MAITRNAYGVPVLFAADVSAFAFVAPNGAAPGVSLPGSGGAACVGVTTAAVDVSVEPVGEIVPLGTGAIVPVLAGAAIDVSSGWVPVDCDAAGRATVATGTDRVLGYATTSTTAANEKVEVLLVGPTYVALS
jgi:hypothetical protein